MSDNKKKKKTNYISKAKLSVLKKDFLTFVENRMKTVDEIFVSKPTFDMLLVEEYCSQYSEKMIKELKIRITKKKFFNIVLDISHRSTYDTNKRNIKKQVDDIHNIVSKIKVQNDKMKKDLSQPIFNEERIEDSTNNCVTNNTFFAKLKNFLHSLIKK